MPTPHRLGPAGRLRARFAHIARRLRLGPRPADAPAAMWRLAVPLAFGVAGLLFVTSAANARGTDLRPGRYTDLQGLVEAQSDRVEGLRQQAAALQDSIDQLSAGIDDQRVQALRSELDRLGPVVGLTAVHGPGLAVSLDDAPRDQQLPADVSPSALVVHQQDIQAVVNALWAGGAEAMSLQGQRIIATTGIKCVGNTVVLHGVPYSPPYRIVAIGDIRRLEGALDASAYIDNYRQYVEQFHLGLDIQPLGDVAVPGYAQIVDLSVAHAADGVPLPGSRGDR
jgi:uncharacterized protein YlxW (UPF0749 family)